VDRQGFVRYGRRKSLDGWNSLEGLLWYMYYSVSIVSLTMTQSFFRDSECK
jgi:hypothetical protein